MGSLGCGCSVIAVLLAIITALPLLGWANIIATIPVALLAIFLSAVAVSRDEQRVLAVLGLFAGALTLFWALFRLSIGGGFI
jgi:hypothetical protein